MRPKQPLISQEFQKNNLRITLASTSELKRFTWDRLRPSLIWKHDPEPFLPRAAWALCFVFLSITARWSGSPRATLMPARREMSKKSHPMALKWIFQGDRSFYSPFSFYFAKSLPNTHELSLVLTAWKIRPNYIFITYQTPFINIKWLRFLCSGFYFPSELQRKEDAAISRLGKKKGIGLYCLSAITLLLTVKKITLKPPKRLIYFQRLFPRKPQFS